MGINVMGRDYYYRAIMDYAQFKPSFLELEGMLLHNY